MMQWYCFNSEDPAPEQVPDKVIAWEKSRGVFVAEKWADHGSDDPSIRGCITWFDSETIQSDTPVPVIFTHWMPFPDPPE